MGIVTDPIPFLKELIAIPSPSGEENAVAEHLVGRMTDLGFRAGRDEVGNVVGVLGDPTAGREIVLLGHMDTVPGFIPVRQSGDRLYGRGSVDAKGPLAAFVLAAARVAPRLRGVRLVVIGGVEEEAHSRGARHLARTMPAPYCAIVGEPSSWQGITLGYKGVLSLEYHLVQPGAHSAAGQPSPAEQAVSFWNQLVDFAAAHNGGEPAGFHTLDPALREISTFGDGLNDGVDVQITARLPPGLDVEGLKQKLRGWCNGAQLKLHPSDPPYQAQKNTPLVRAMLRAIREEGGRPRFKLKSGTSDMNIIGPAWGCPIVAYGPGDSSLDHTPNEHIQIQEFHKGIDVLARALQALIDS